MSKIWHEHIPPSLFNKLKDACIERRKDEDWNYNDKLVGALNQQSSLVPTEGVGRLSRPYFTEYLAHILSDMPI